MINNDIVKLSDSHKHLGLWLSHNLTWKKHIKEMASKARKRLGCLQKNKYRMSRKSLELCYLTFVRPVLEYGCVLYDSANKEDLDILTEIEKEALRVITGARKRCNLDTLYDDFKWPCLEKRRENQKIVTLGKIIIKQFPSYLMKDLPTYYSQSRTHRNNTFAIPASRHDYYTKSFIPSSITLWNDLSPELRALNSYKSLKSKIKSNSESDTPPYFHHGKRAANILHSKLRLGCSDLKVLCQ